MCDPTVLDLFSGMGGMPYGFAEAGFEVTEVDTSEFKERTRQYVECFQNF